MQATTDETILTQQTRNLCQTLVEQPEFIQIRQRIEAFLSDDSAKNLYQTVMEKGDELQQKQQMGLPLDQNEILAFEQDREKLLNLPVARGFLDAQQEMHKIQESVMQFVGKTFELGRVPAPEDFPAEGCGSGCGCGH
jgi:cell fate (sporulation/competence/biofilm development) regulator YlbF (YheA/YmcA/DUF963 family)